MAGDPTAAEDQDPRELLGAVGNLRSRLRSEENRHREELQNFAYAVSHDLREPLRMVASYTQLLRRRYESQLDGEAHEFMQFITESVERMERLLNDLLTYSRQFRASDKPVSEADAEVALAGVLLNLEKPIRESGAQITHGALPKVVIDFPQLTQLFQQLIANSILFRASEPPRIHISAEDDDDHCTFSVRDNGLGIEPRYHEQIFGVFKRLQGREYPGTGMGLAIAKRIVEQYGGRIWVESEAGKGATFRFTLPR